MCLPSGETTGLLSGPRRSVSCLRDRSATVSSYTSVSSGSYSPPGRPAAVQPADVQLRRAVGVGDVGQALAVGRPARRRVAVVAGRQRLVPGFPLRVDDPEVRPASILLDVEEGADVDDPLTVGR